MRMTKPIAYAGMAIWLTGSLALAQGVQQQIGINGSVNFTQRTIQATGVGLPGAVGGRAGVLRAAKMDALRNLLEVINGIALTSSTTVENQILSSDIVKTRVEGIAKMFRQVGSEKFYDDGSVEITIEMSLDGPFLEAVLPSRTGSAQPLASAVKGHAYTGLIVDATGLGARPALAPRILNEEGQEVYGSSFAGREWAVKYGMVGYEREVSSATRNDRVADRPLLARGLRTSGPNSADIVISNQDAQMLHSLRENLNFLEKCRVIIILD
jgi:hypothetical protein